jgi:alpha-N-arabinofuranosidase
MSARMPTTLTLLAALAAGACQSAPPAGGSDGGPAADGGPGDAGAPDAGPQDAGPPPRCALTDVCISVDATGSGHVVSPLLFGDWIEWETDGVSNGDFLWDVVTGAPQPALISALSPLGLTILRYPGGTIGDLFHWYDAVGPLNQRTPQLNAFAVDAGETVLPIFGPAEFAQVAGQLGAQMLITANAGSGTASEAAGWLAYYEDAGYRPMYWEIGNEVYIPSTVGGSWAVNLESKTASQYAALFDQYAQALRAIDPAVKVGMIGCASCPGWDQTVLQGVTERIDFMAVHNSYAPYAAYTADTHGALTATLADPVNIRAAFDLTESHIAQYAGANADMELAETESAAVFAPSGTSTDVDWLALNRSLAAALFSAGTYDVYLGDPRITLANHTNMVNPYLQAMVTTSPADGVSLPTRSALGMVFRLYADTAGGTSVGAPVQNSPTFDTSGFGMVPPIYDVPVLDTAAVISRDGSKLWLYVINRDLTENATARVIALGFPSGPVASVLAETLNGPSAASENDPGVTPGVTLTSSPLPLLRDFSYAFPAHSLTRLTFQ